MSDFVKVNIWILVFDLYLAMDHIEWPGLHGYLQLHLQIHLLQAVKPDDESGSARFEASEALCPAAEMHVTPSIWLQNSLKIHGKHAMVTKKKKSKIEWSIS